MAGLHQKFVIVMRYIDVEVVLAGIEEPDKDKETTATSNGKLVDSGRTVYFSENASKRLHVYETNSK